MKTESIAGSSSVDDGELHACLARVVASRTGQPVRDIEVERRPSPYRSSHPVEEIEVRTDGSALHLVFKDLGANSLLPDARAAKPEFLMDPRREIEVYERLLVDEPATPALYGGTIDAEIGRFWLFLERVSGPDLSQVGDVAVWQAAARWLARFHSRWDGAVEKGVANGALIRYDESYFRRWLERAQEFCSKRAGIVGGEARKVLRRVESSHCAFFQKLQALPRTVLHGEFYPSNVIVGGTGPAARICPIDWEMAAIGPALVDLAALTSGKWSDQQRAVIATAYWEEHARLGPALEPGEFMGALEACRLHLAIQWLGWSLEWSPPPHQAHDWLGEAVRSAERAGL